MTKCEDSNDGAFVVRICRFNTVMEWCGLTYRQRSQSKRETTAGVRRSGFILTAADNFQHTQYDHSRAYITGRRGPQGKHAPVKIKSALGTSKWLTFVFPWPIEVSFSQQ